MENALKCCIYKTDVTFNISYMEYWIYFQFKIVIVFATSLSPLFSISEYKNFEDDFGKMNTFYTCIYIGSMILRLKIFSIKW